MKKRTEKIMSENIPQLVEDYFNIVLAKKKADKFTDNEKDRILKSFELVVSKLPIHSPDIKATNTADILKLLRRGKITIDEAERLMQIMQTEFEIKELPKLLASFEELQGK